MKIASILLYLIIMTNPLTGELSIGNEKHLNKLNMNSIIKSLTFTVALLICHNFYGQNGIDFQPKFIETTETTNKINDKQKYTFGYLEVLENRDRPNGNTIKLPIYIFKSRSENPKSDPIVYTVGGPGYTSMRASKYMKYYQYLDDRDFILFEQRGTQYAKPSLDCPEWSKAIYQSNLPNSDTITIDRLFHKVARA